MKRIALLIAFSLLAIGCRSTPSELQDLQPTTITVTDAGKPVPGVRVTLSATTPNQAVWNCSGVTDASGKAVVASSLRAHVHNGAPPGTYKIVLLGSVELPDELKPTQAEADAAIPEDRLKDLTAKRDAFIAEHSLIPKSLETAETSPVEVIVEQKNKNELTIDISKYRSTR